MNATMCIVINAGIRRLKHRDNFNIPMSAHSLEERFCKRNSLMPKGLLEINMASLNLQFSTLLFSLCLNTASHAILYLSNFVIYINSGAFVLTHIVVILLRSYWNTRVQSLQNNNHMTLTACKIVCLLQRHSYRITTQLCPLQFKTLDMLLAFMII